MYHKVKSSCQLDPNLLFILYFVQDEQAENSLKNCNAFTMRTPSCVKAIKSVCRSYFFVFF